MSLCSVERPRFPWERWRGWTRRHLERPRWPNTSYWSRRIWILASDWSNTDHMIRILISDWFIFRPSLTTRLAPPPPPPWSAWGPVPTVAELLRWILDYCDWLICTCHVTTILASDLSILIMWPEYWPLIGQYLSFDLNTGLWLVNTDLVTWILTPDWSIIAGPLHHRHVQEVPPGVLRLQVDRCLYRKRTFLKSEMNNEDWAISLKLCQTLWLLELLIEPKIRAKWKQEAYPVLSWKCFAPFSVKESSLVRVNDS